MKGTKLGVGLGAGGMAALGLIACGGAPAPHEREASSQAAIRAASEMRAEQQPESALQLKLAEEQFNKGKALMKDGDNDRANYVFMRAQADAELALAMARESKSKAEAQVLIDKLRAARGPVPTSAQQSPSGGNH